MILPRERQQRLFGFVYVSASFIGILMYACILQTWETNGKKALAPRMGQGCGWNRVWHALFRIVLGIYRLQVARNPALLVELWGKTGPLVACSRCRIKFREFVFTWKVRIFCVLSVQRLVNLVVGFVWSAEQYCVEMRAKHVVGPTADLQHNITLATSIEIEQKFGARSSWVSLFRGETA